ncbi:AsnC family transcriptional regulator [Niveispirillum sp. BGYR6]|uniref:Lrp/AsnC family transcriptional regulator n=1 Tax=Niveispirillum sp. BGYR6 TaxID=2971249 RepID=UPI0022B9783E|nr:AsnC family transcriptional regulator [Niveispirillum sp. BGYR6]
MSDTGEQDGTDLALLQLLRANAREPTASLARKLGLARSSVQARIARLERLGIIQGYTLRSDYATARLIRAYVLLSTNPKMIARIVGDVKRIAEVESLSAISGSYDMMAVVAAPTVQDIDRVLDQLGLVTGVERTMSSLVLSDKFRR